MTTRKVAFTLALLTAATVGTACTAQTGTALAVVAFIACMLTVLFYEPEHNGCGSVSPCLSYPAPPNPEVEALMGDPHFRSLRDTFFAARDRGDEKLMMETLNQIMADYRDSLGHNWARVQLMQMREQGLLLAEEEPDEQSPDMGERGSLERQRLLDRLQPRLPSDVFDRLIDDDREHG